MLLRQMLSTTWWTLHVAARCLIMTSIMLVMEVALLLFLTQAVLGAQKRCVNWQTLEDAPGVVLDWPEPVLWIVGAGMVLLALAIGIDVAVPGPLPKENPDADHTV